MLIYIGLKALPVRHLNFSETYINLIPGRDVSSTQLNGGSGLHNLQTAKVSPGINYRYRYHLPVPVLHK
jgi:hypothetical protein